jgi:hypothetical protein
MRPAECPGSVGVYHRYPLLLFVNPETSSLTTGLENTLTHECHHVALDWVFAGYHPGVAANRSRPNPAGPHQKSPKELCLASPT